MDLDIASIIIPLHQKDSTDGFRATLALCTEPGLYLA
jgi:hypothetical protein